MKNLFFVFSLLFIVLGCTDYLVQHENLEGITADFTFTDVSDCPAPCTVSFTDASVSRVSITKYQWNFEGADSDEANPVYTFINPGTYPVSLKVTNEDGVSDIKEEMITIDGITFEKSYSAYKEGKKIIEVEDGYVVCGEAEDGNGTDVFLIKIDREGNQISSFGDIYDISDSDFVEDMIQIGSEFVLVGHTKNEANNNAKEIFYLYTDSNGKAKSGGPKTITFNGCEGGQFANGVIQDQNSDAVLITGFCFDGCGGNLDVFLKKTDITGTTNFEPFNECINLIEQERPYSILQTNIGLVIAGRSTSSSGNQAIVIPTDQNGIVEFGNVKKISAGDILNAATADNQGNLFFVGRQNNSGSEDMFFLKTDTRLTINAPFPRSLDLPNSNAFDVIPFGDENNIILAGEIDGKAALVNFDWSENSIIWQKPYGARGGNSFKSAASTSDGGIVATGTQNDVLYIIKTNQLGEL